MISLMMMHGLHGCPECQLDYGNQELDQSFEIFCAAIMGFLFLTGYEKKPLTLNVRLRNSPPVKAVKNTISH